MNLTHLLSMNGYGVYVWPAYCIMALVFAINFFGTFKEKNRIKKIVRQYIEQVKQAQ